MRQCQKEEVRDYGVTVKVVGAWKVYLNREGGYKGKMMYLKFDVNTKGRDFCVGDC